MASAGSGRAASAAILLLLCLAAAGGDRDHEFNERGALSPGLSDKSLVTPWTLGDPERQKACNVEYPQPPGVRYILSALKCVLQQHMMDSWAGSEKLAEQLASLRRQRMCQPRGGCPTVADELKKSRWKWVQSRRADGPKALLTEDERFRIEPLLEDEYTFWTENGEAIVQHWLHNPLSAMVKYYAIVSEDNSNSQMWVVMREAANQMQRKYVLTGQDSNGADAEEDREIWPQYLFFESPERWAPTTTPAGRFYQIHNWLFATTQAPTTTTPPRRSRYKEFYEAVQKDVEFLDKLNVTDYSLVVRTARAEDKGSSADLWPKEPWRMENRQFETMKLWNDFPEFKGAGSVFKTMQWPRWKTFLHCSPHHKERPSMPVLEQSLYCFWLFLQPRFSIASGKAFEVSVEIVDYLRGAKEKTASGSHSDSLLRQVRRKFRPFTVDQWYEFFYDARIPSFRCCISNPEAGVGDPSPEELEEEIARGETEGICTPFPSKKRPRRF